MMFFHRYILLSLVAAFPPNTASAEDDISLRLTTALYFDCAVPTGSADLQPVSFDVSYLVYADGKNSPQINFYDPSERFITGRGWAPENIYPLTQHSSNGTLFVATIEHEQGKQPNVQFTATLKSDPEAGEEASLVLTKFNRSAEDIVTAETFSGNCVRITGAPAYYRFANGEEQ